MVFSNLFIIIQTVIRLSCTRSGAVEQFAFHAELTNRDKDHVSLGLLIKAPLEKGQPFYSGQPWMLSLCSENRLYFIDSWSTTRWWTVYLWCLHMGMWLWKIHQYRFSRHSPKTGSSFSTCSAPLAFHCAESADWPALPGCSSGCGTKGTTCTPLPMLLFQWCKNWREGRY